MKDVFDQLVAVLSPRIPGAQFDNLMGVAREISAQNPRGLADLVNAILRPLQAERLIAVAERSLHGSPGPITSTEFFMGQTSSGVFMKHENLRLAPEPFMVDLSRHIVLPTPWLRERFVSALSLIGTGKMNGQWQQDEANHLLILWLPWGIGFVTNGNHSIASGILMGEGRLTPTEVYDLSGVFKAITCNGRHYFDAINKTPIAPVTDQRRAAVFEIGRLMVQAGVCAFPDADRCPFNS